VAAADISARGPHAALADAVMETVRGGSAAQAVVYAIRTGHAAPDALLEAILACDGDRLRGLARELQKAIERGTPA